MMRLSAVAALLFALSPAFAVELEGPAGKTPAPTPVPVVPASLTPVVPIPSANALPEGVRDGSLPLADLSQTASPTAAVSPTASASASASAAAKTQAPTPRAKAEGRVIKMSAAVAKAAEAAGKSDATGENRSGAGRTIEEAITGEEARPSEDYVSVYLQGVRDGTIATGPRLEPSGARGEYRVRTGYNVLYGAREQFVNPGHVYAEAYYAASHAAKKMGLSGRVFFAEVKGSLPLRDGAHAKFTFYPSGPQARRSVIYVDFSRSITTIHGDFDVKTSVFTGAPAPTMLFWPDFDKPEGYNYMDRAFYGGPESALDAARRRFLDFGPAASFSARIEKDEKTGDVDAWYHLYDDKGNQVDVNARTNEARLVKAAPKAPPTPWSEVARHSGGFAMLGLAAIGMWFGLAYGLTRDAAWALSLIKPVVALVSVIVGVDVWQARTRPKK